MCVCENTVDGGKSLHVYRPDLTRWTTGDRNPLLPSRVKLVSGTGPLSYCQSPVSSSPVVRVLKTPAPTRQVRSVVERSFLNSRASYKYATGWDQCGSSCIRRNQFRPSTLGS